MIFSLWWQIIGIVLFLSVFVVIGLNMTLFADDEYIEIEVIEIDKNDDIISLLWD